MTSLDRFDHPLTGRYASEEMQRIFSTGNRYTTWRRLWLALASAEKELGLEIPDDALEQMLAHLDVTADDLERVREYEKRTRHDVMAHLEAFADRAPAAKPILHLGATSAFVGDNADLIITRDALDLVITRVLAVIAAIISGGSSGATELRPFKNLKLMIFNMFSKMSADTLCQDVRRFFGTLDCDQINMPFGIVDWTQRSAT